MKRVFKYVSLLSLLFAGFANAGDAELGKAKSAQCAACHGADGNSANPLWPKLAGQHEQYTARQLLLFKNGERKGTVMPGMVAALNEDDMNNLAAYFATQKSSIGSADENLVEVGKALYQGGSAKMKIPACMSCHGIGGKGNPLSGYPVLAGQHAAYTEQRLLAFKSGETVANEDDVNGNVMADVVKYLSDEEIKAISSYIQGLYVE
jgi:cytochrome c553